MMQPDYMPQIRQIQQRAERLIQLASEFAYAVPEWPEGCDATGYALVALGPGGQPSEIRILDRWQQRLEPEHLASAVMEANAHALSSAMRALVGRLDDIHWPRRQRDADQSPDIMDRPALPSDGMPTGWAREDAEFNEQVLRALREIRHQQVAEPMATEGADAGRRVIVRLGSGGLTDCAIDPQWACRCDGHSISASLSTALERAKGVHVPAFHGRERIGALVDDALATLKAWPPT